MRWFTILFGSFVAVVSSFFVMAAIGDLVKGDSDTETGVLLGLVVFFALTGGGGAYAAVRTVRNSRKERSEKVERSLLKLIEKLGGRVTPAEIAVHTDLSLEEAERELRKLCLNGAGSLFVTDQGNTVYVFSGFLPPEEKLSAKSPLDI